jgi:hypothetical protein
MPRLLWQLRRGRPCIEVVLRLTQGGKPFPRILLADTGASSRNSSFQLIFEEDDCLLCGGLPDQSIELRGAFSGTFPTYDLPVQIPSLGFHQNLLAVGVPSVPAGFDGIACFSFLDRFTYGNFGDPDQFGLEC